MHKSDLFKFDTMETFNCRRNCMYTQMVKRHQQVLDHESSLTRTQAIDKTK